MAWKGIWLVCDSQKVVNTSTPRADAMAESSRTRRLFPIPGGPTTPTTAPWPSIARSNKPSNGGHLPPPTDQIRLGTPDAAMPVRHAQQPLGRHWLVGTLDPNHLRLAQSRCAINQSRGGRAEHHPTRRSDRLHPLSHPDLLTDGGVTERRRTDFTGDHLTRVQAHPQAAARHRRDLGPRRQAASLPPECPTPPDRHEQRGPPTPPARRTPP